MGIIQNLLEKGFSAFYKKISFLPQSFSTKEFSAYEPDASGFNCLIKDKASKIVFSRTCSHNATNPLIVSAISKLHGNNALYLKNGRLNQAEIARAACVNRRSISKYLSLIKDEIDRITGNLLTS